MSTSNPILSDLDNVVNNDVATFAEPSAPVNPQTENTTRNTRFSSTPPWLLPENSSLKWAWIEDHGPFVTNGNSQHPHFEDSETESDTTAIMFNLDSLNEERPEIAQNGLWRKGYIPELPDSFIENLVQRVDRKRFRFESGGPSDGPSLLPNQTEEAQHVIPQNLTCPFPKFEPT